MHLYDIVTAHEREKMVVMYNRIYNMSYKEQKYGLMALIIC